jgi:hypothetical protein
MKLPIFFAVLLALSNYTFSQEKIEFYQVPKEIQKDSKELSRYLVKDAVSDSSKAAQLYQWITHNISYDYAVIENGKQLEYMSAMDVLKEKKTVCQGYSALFVELLKNEGIQAATVEGYTSDFLSDSILTLVGCDHEWVIFKADNKWYQCDPTWDAGYIGRISKYKSDLVKVDKMLKKRKEKLDETSKEKKKARLTKRYAAHDLKELKKKENLSGKYESSVGFVRNPSLTYFMMSSDTFVQTHLASIPALQLREYPIGMADFTMKTKSWDTIIERKKGKPLDYAVFANEYTALSLNKQWLERADEGFLFNDISYLTKIAHYYNFIGLHLNEDFREQVAVVSKADLNTQMFRLQIMNDSILTYIKPARNVTKDAFKTSKSLMSSFSKQYKTTDKQANSLIVKVISAQEKSIDLLKDADEKVKKNLEYLRDKEAKLASENRTIEENAAFDETSVPESFLTWKDSLFAVQLKIDSLRSNWNVLMHGDKLFQERHEVIENALTNSYYNQYILNASTAFFDDTVVHYDTILAQNFDYLFDFYKNRMNELYYPEEILKEYKNFDRLIKNGMTRLKKYSAKNSSFKPEKINDYVVSANYSLVQAIIQDNYQYKSDCAVLIRQERIYSDLYEDLKDDLEEEKKLKVKNIEYSQEVLEKDKERTFKMIDEMESGAKKLDIYFAKRLAF